MSRLGRNPFSEKKISEEVIKTIKNTQKDFVPPDLPNLQDLHVKAKKEKYNEDESPLVTAVKEVVEKIAVDLPAEGYLAGLKTFLKMFRK